MTRSTTRTSPPCRLVSHHVWFAFFVGSRPLILTRASPLDRHFAGYSTVAISGPHPADSGAYGGLLTSRDGSSATMDVTPQLRPRGSGLRVRRRVVSRADEAHISWTLTNEGESEVAIGGLGVSMPFNQVSEHPANDLPPMCDYPTNDPPSYV